MNTALSVQSTGIGDLDALLPRRPGILGKRSEVETILKAIDENVNLPRNIPERLLKNQQVQAKALDKFEKLLKLLTLLAKKHDDKNGSTDFDTLLDSWEQGEAKIKKQATKLAYGFRLSRKAVQIKIDKQISTIQVSDDFFHNSVWHSLVDIRVELLGLKTPIP